MVLIKCNRCEKEIECEATCLECSEEELKELSSEENTCPCDNCGKELLGRTANQEITLFYKDANKDFNFCSRECLIKFVQDKLED